MAFNFTTGPTTLPDVGELSYNGCIFGPLFETKVSGKVIKDAAGRTTKFLEYLIEVDGYVTLELDGSSDISQTMATLRLLLTQQAGILTYKGRGSNIVVNSPGGTVYDAAWGPVPELLDFAPLGAGLSAKIKWAVTTRIPEVQSPGRLYVLQFNSETTVSYDEAGFSTLTIKGTLEIPLTRPTQGNRRLAVTVDDYRSVWLDQVANSIDLTRFRVVRRNFAVSRDDRTMEWDFQAEEIPYMGLPPFCTVAHGSYSVRQAKASPGMVNWLCTLRCTYTIPNQTPRRTAWLAFLALLRLRMMWSQQSTIPLINGGAQNPGIVGIGLRAVNQVVGNAARGVFGNAQAELAGENAPIANANRALFIDFSIDEGLYLDSKTITFSATWTLKVVFAEIIKCSGIWRQVEPNNNNWAISVTNISGSQSWLKNKLNPTQEVIVDFGGSF